MKKINFSNTEKLLICIILILILIIMIGTIAVKTKQSEKTTEKLLQQGKAVSLMAPSEDSETAYFELGALRILTGSTETDEDSEQPLLVISPWLAYSAGDTVFYEELVRKRGIIKGIFMNYFSQRTKNQLLSETEQKIEVVIKDEINEQLSLGQISDIYFTDYIFLE